MSEKTLDGEIRYYEDGTPATAENLNKPLEDLAKTGQYMSEAQFKSLVKNRKFSFGGSGFVEWGKTYSSLNNQINEGMLNLSPGIDRENRIALSYTNTSEVNEQPLVNLNGELLRLGGISGLDTSTEILFPEAPTINGTESSMSSLSKDYKIGDTAYFTNTTEDLHRLISTSIDGSGTLIDNNDGTYTHARHGDSSYAWYHSREKYSVGVRYKFVLEIVDNPNNLTYLNFGMYGMSKYISENGYNIVDNKIEFEFIPTSHHNNNSMYINGFSVGDSITYKKPVITLAEPQNITFSRNYNQGSSFLTGSKPYIMKKNKISRQDLVFLESWHELIDEKDIVYPLGNIQYNSDNTDGLSGITEGVFSGAETYSLFGTWQEPGDTIGKGYVWSLLSQEDKLKFASNPENNIYMSKDGLVQVRYRIRVIKGINNDTNGINSSLPQLGRTPITGAIDNGYLIVKGKETTSWDYGVRTTISGGNYIFASTTSTNTRRSDYNGTWTSDNRGSDICSYNTIVCALPIALVQRRNQGAFDPVWNPEGCATFSDGKMWYETSATHNNIIDCFNNKLNGDIGSSVSGRPDGLLFDNITNRDIEDLRMSADKVTDKEQYLDDTYNKAISGNWRGKESTKETHIATVVYAGVKSSTDTNSSRLRIRFYEQYANIISDRIGRPGAYDHRVKIQHPDLNGGALFDPAYLDFDYGNTLLFDNYGDGGSFFDNMAIGSEVKVFIDDIEINASSVTFDNNYPVQNNDALVCDIIGNPSDYPQKWKDNNIFGSPLLFGEEHNTDKKLTSLLPTNAQISANSRKFKLSRKVSEFYNTTYFNMEDVLLIGTKVDGTQEKINSYVSTTTVQTDGDINIGWYGENVRNYIIISQLALDTYPVIQIFYTTKADFTIASSNEQIETIGKQGNFAQYNTMDHGSLMSRNLINKVSTGTDAGTDAGAYPGNIFESFNIQPQTDKHVNSLTLCTSSNRRPTEHEPITAIHGGPGAKYFPYLTRESNNRAKMNIVFKEMKWDYNADNYTDTKVIDTLIDDINNLQYKVPKGELVHIINSDTIPNGTYVGTNWTSTSTINLLSQNTNRIGSDGSIYGYANDLLISMWDGNGWGDNSKFEIISGTNRIKDDNNNVILYGQKAIRLNHFLD